MSLEADKVLIVEDERGWSKLLYIFLSGANILSEVKATKEDALATIKEGHYPVILLDGNLSGDNTGEDGFEIGKAIRESDHNRDSYIINISGSNENPYADERVEKKNIRENSLEFTIKIANLLAQRRAE